MKKNWITSTGKTYLIVIILIILFIVINLFVRNIDLAQIDVTENKLYSITDSTKQAIKDINQQVIIYAFGYEESSPLIDLLKQYKRENNNINYEILSKATNPEKVAEYELEDGYSIVVVECNGSHKLIDGSYQFYTYDYTTGQSIDTTEQTITNAILSLTVEEKPKVYFTTGHGEYSLEQLNVIQTYLKNEVYEVEEINLLTQDNVPDDCAVLAIMTPTSDFIEKEAESIKNYINKGGNIIFFRDIELNKKEYPIFQSILDLYGVTMEDGCIIETNTKNMVSSQYPNIIIPELSSTHDITKYLYSSNGYLVMMYAGRIKIADEETLNNLGVESETIISSSDTSVYIEDLSNISLDGVTDKGSNTIGAVLTKTINNQETNESAVSKLVVVANNYFTTDYKESTLSSTYPFSYFGNNKDILLNSVAYLTKREDTLTIRKDMKNTTYAATVNENRIILTIIFAVPIIIIIIGIVVWNIRKRK